jgi:prepilin-type N-terminal cleavage/methylation domain-containing protein
MEPVCDADCLRGSRPIKRQHDFELRMTSAINLKMKSLINHRPRTGFTLVELMVVVLVIAAILGLLMPVIVGARSAARRTQCLNLLGQVGLATVTYESSTGCLPAGGWVAEPTVPSRADALYFNPRTGKQFSWIVELLPFMEESTLFASIDFELSVTQQASDPQAKVIGSLVCASDPTRGSQFVFEGKTFAKSNLAGFASPYRIETMSHWAGALGGVRPGQRRGGSLSSVIDGAAKTLLASEVLTSAEVTDQRGAWALPWAGASLVALNVPHESQLGDDDDLARIAYAPTGDVSLLAESQTPNKTTGTQFDRLYDFGMPAPDDQMPYSVTQDGLGLYASPRSGHVGGVNVVALDGHAAFLANDIDGGVLARLVAIADGQLLKRGGRSSKVVDLPAKSE